MPDRLGMNTGDPNRQQKGKQRRSKYAKQKAERYHQPPPPLVRGDSSPERSCYAKIRYGTKAIAKDAAEKVFGLGKSAEMSRTYYCRYCQGWHLTTGR